MAEIRSRPVATSLEANHLNLSHETRRHRRNLSIWKSCETVNGERRRLRSLRTEIREALVDLLREMALDDE